MSDYFHESVVAKMVSSNGYQEGYSVGFANGLKQGRADKYQEIVSEYMLLTEKQVEDIMEDERAKVLDEVLKILANEKWDYTLVNKIEQLKEQKKRASVSPKAARCSQHELYV